MSRIPTEFQDFKRDVVAEYSLRTFRPFPAILQQRVNITARMILCMKDRMSIEETVDHLIHEGFLIGRTYDYE